MHHVYTVEAIIVKSVPIGEANKYYFLLTKDLGLIKASAQGVRLGKSKLKGHLQDFNFISVSLVKGKNIWRITSVDTLNSFNFLRSLNKLVAIKNVFSLLLRLVHGEEKNESLFNVVGLFYDFLTKNNLSLEDIKSLEIITVLRILYYLGYFKKSFDLIDFVDNNQISAEVIESFADKKRAAIADINEALKESHL